MTQSEYTIHNSMHAVTITYCPVSDSQRRCTYSRPDSPCSDFLVTIQTQLVFGVKQSLYASMASAISFQFEISSEPGK
eukprot:COSAG01_NODE_1490_length_10131_cov_15.364135_3_plen_78_part_00